MTRAGTTAAMLAVGLSTLVAGSSWATTPPDTPGASGTTEAADRAFEQLSSCVSSDDTEEIAAQFLVDESGSLKSNDKDDLRVDALEAAVVSLEDLAAQLTDVDKRVTALGATFAEGYSVRQDWTLVSSDATGIRGFIEQVGDLEDGQGTNYVAALAGARESFQSRSQACRVLYWFTDGKLDMGFAGAEQSNDEAWRTLSEEQGLIDAMRAEGIAVIALPLFSDDADEDLRAGPIDRARLQALAEGIGSFGGVTEEAGTLDNGRVPDGLTPGAYLESADPSVLSSYFSYAISRSAGYTGVQTTQCPSSDCPDGRLAVPVEPGITRTQVLLVADEEPGAITVLDRDTRPLLSVNPGEDASADSGIPDVSVTWSGLLARIDIDTEPTGRAAGEWTIETDPKRPSQATVLMQSGLQIALPGDRPPLIAGESAALELTITYPDGSPVEPTVFADWSVAAGLSDLAPTTPSGPSTYTVEVTPEGDSSSAALKTDVQIVTKNGYPLDSLSPSFTLPVAPPDGFPRVESITFPDAVGTSPVTGTLLLRGAQQGTTEVTLGAPTIESPDGAGPQALAFPGVAFGQPITLEAGQQQAVEITFTPVQSVDGLASGTIPISLDSLQQGQTNLDQEVPFSIAMARPVDQAERAAWVAVFAVLSVLLPLLLLYLVARHVAQLQLPSGLFALTAPVVISPDGRLRSPSGAPPDSSPGDWQRPAATSKRRCTAGPLRVKTGVTRSIKPAVWAEVRTGDVASADNPHLGQHRGQAPADVNPSGAWYLCVTDVDLQGHRRATDNADLPVTLVAFTDVNQPDGSIESVNGRLQTWSSGSRVVEQWLERLPTTSNQAHSKPPDSARTPDQVRPSHEAAQPPNYASSPGPPTAPSTPPAPRWTKPASSSSPQPPPPDEGPPKYV